MMTSRPPFNNANPDEDEIYCMFVVRPDKFWKLHEKEGCQHLSPDFKNLIEKMLALNPKERATIEEIQNHKWFQGPVPDIKVVQKEFATRKKNLDIQ